MKNITCCFTGHRNILEKEFLEIQKRLKIEIIKLIEQGVCYFGSGGAMGFDIMAAQAVIELKSIYKHIKLILVLPCKEHTINWKQKDNNKFDYIFKKADKIVYISEHYYKGCMHKRNRHLVENSGFCICYLTKTSGGTMYTADYAVKTICLFIISPYTCKILQFLRTRNDVFFVKYKFFF